MFKKLETKWNARTPVYLHNGSKENIMLQLSLTALLILGFYVKDWYDERLRTQFREEQRLYGPE